MSTKNKHQIRSIFMGALECPKKYRDIWLETSCCGNSHVQTAVTKLLLHVSDNPDLPIKSPIGTTVGRWLIVRLLGKGGMGKVYEGIAEEPWDGPNVAAVKFVSEQNDEFSLLKKINHSGVVKIYEKGNEPEPWYAMELVPLAENIIDGAADHARTLNQRLSLIIEVCEAVAEIHAVGLVHNDISPNNLLVDFNGHVHVTDFGLAHTIKFVNTSIGGTFAYMAPEQFDSSAHNTEQTDVYSICVVLFRLLCGFNPYPVPSNYQSAEHVITNLSPIPPRSLSPNIPSELEKLLLRGLSKNPTQRPKNASELCALLKDLRDGKNAKTNNKTIRVASLFIIIVVFAVLFLQPMFSKPLSRYSQSVLVDKPVGYWALNNHSSDAINLGTVGSFLDGTVTGDVDYGYEGGILFRSGGIKIPAHSALNLSGPLTVELWFKLDEVDNLGTTYALAKGRDLDAGFYRISLGRAGDLIYLRAAGHNGIPVIDTTVHASFDTWHHFVWVVSPESDVQQIWLDGSLVASMSIPGGLFGTNDGSLTIGRHGEKSATYHHRGAIDDVAIYQESLSKDQILNHWESRSIR